MHGPINPKYKFCPDILSEAFENCDKSKQTHSPRHITRMSTTMRRITTFRSTTDRLNHGGTIRF